MKTVRRFKAFLRGERGVSALEYAILVGVIAVAVTAAITLFGGQLQNAITNIGTNLGTATSNTGSPSP